MNKQHQSTEECQAALNLIRKRLHKDK